MNKHILRVAVLTIAMLVLGVSGAVGGEIVFDPVRAPSVGPDSAPVTVYEIADFM